MTPSEIETAARQLYNATQDTFFTQAEILNRIYAAELTLCREAISIQAYTTSTSTSGTGTYNFPTNFIAVKRLTYDGAKLQPITLREFDSLTVSNSLNVEIGTPTFYYEWNKQVKLWPTPDTSSLTIEWFGYKQPTVPTASSTLEVPELFHWAIVNFVVASMYEKDMNIQMASYYRNLWDREVMDAKRWYRKQKRADAFTVVQDEDLLPVSDLGAV